MILKLISLFSSPRTDFLIISLGFEATEGFEEGLRTPVRAKVANRPIEPAGAEEQPRKSYISL